MPVVGLKTLNLTARAVWPGQEVATAEGQRIAGKIAIGRALIKLLQEDDDPRAPEVAAHLQAQLADLTRQLEEAKGGTNGGR